MGVGRMLGSFVLVLVGLALTPTVATQVSLASGNLTGAAETALIALVTIFWVIGIIAAAAKVGGFSFKS